MLHSEPPRLSLFCHGSILPTGSSLRETRGGSVVVRVNACFAHLRNVPSDAGYVGERCSDCLAAHAKESAEMPQQRAR